MLSNVVILLSENIPTALKSQELLQKFKREVWSHPPNKQDLVPNLCSKCLYGTTFCSNSDVKTAAENWLNGQGPDFNKAGETSWSCVQINA
ncbi:hypothetical protein AVEN_42622-1 [Araneus ventricosus]|uniref:Uncharacterized protein n=1 Tax=Araneus ventricosus TaxID=182803 RepID=A0A4Y2BNH2_ARAVE|nr:hypothetical protein AVEN_42622-1 [Araneus ventricosus]